MWSVPNYSLFRERWSVPDFLYISAVSSLVREELTRIMIPLHYQVVGEEDYAFDISIDTGGQYLVSGGTYTSDRPRSGKLTRDQERALEDAIEALGLPAVHEAPEGAADAFRAQLILGEGKSATVYPFWQGSLPEDSKLQDLVRLLEMV